MPRRVRYLGRTHAAPVHQRTEPGLLGEWKDTTAGRKRVLNAKGHRAFSKIMERYNGQIVKLLMQATSPTTLHARVTTGRSAVYAARHAGMSMDEIRECCAIGLMAAIAIWNPKAAKACKLKTLIVIHTIGELQQYLRKYIYPLRNLPTAGLHDNLTEGSALRPPADPSPLSPEETATILALARPSEAAVIARVYGLMGHHPLSYQEIAEELGMTLDSVRQTRFTGVRRIKRAMKRDADILPEIGGRRRANLL